MTPETTVVAILCVILYCQYLLAIDSPYRSNVLFCVFILSNFMIYYMNTRYREHITTIHRIDLWKWLLLLGLFGYLFGLCPEEHGAKKRMIKGIYVVILIFLFNC